MYWHDNLRINNEYEVSNVKHLDMIVDGSIVFMSAKHIGLAKRPGMSPGSIGFYMYKTSLTLHACAGAIQDKRLTFVYDLYEASPGGMMAW
jgi:hypothetical protein